MRPSCSTAPGVPPAASASRTRTSTASPSPFVVPVLIAPSQSTPVTPSGRQRRDEPVGDALELARLLPGHVLGRGRPQDLLHPRRRPLVDDGTALALPRVALAARRQARVADLPPAGAFTEVLAEIRGKIAASEFRVISASRAERLMKDKLFERVFALRQRAFTSAFRNAEIDMHFSLTREMVPVRDFLATVASESPQRVAVLLYQGEVV